MSILIFLSVQKVGVSSKKMKDTVDFVLESVKKPGLVSVHVIGDKRMRRLNREYRGKDKTTDVLSFAATEEAFPFNDQEETDWGDIFISADQIRRQAQEYGVSYKEEFLRMLVHGTLHLLGYDHEKPKDAKVMFPLQEKIVQELV